MEIILIGRKFRIHNNIQIHSAYFKKFSLGDNNDNKELVPHRYNSDVFSPI